MTSLRTTVEVASSLATAFYFCGVFALLMRTIASYAPNTRENLAILNAHRTCRLLLMLITLDILWEKRLISPSSKSNLAFNKA